MTSPRPAQLLRTPSLNLPNGDELEAIQDQDGSSFLPFGSSTDLLASLDPYEGDVSGWLNDLLDPLEDEMLKEGDQVSSWVELSSSKAREEKRRAEPGGVELRACLYWSVAGEEQDVEVWD